MNRRCGGLLLMTILTLTASLAQARTLVFYAVPRVDQPPRIDGDLSDEVWQNAAPARTYYEYWKPYPGLGALATEFRMVYDHRGIYLAILNHDDNLANLRANVIARDDPKLWQDDCAEIYFDPAALGVGYTKFVANSIATQQDLRRQDAAVTLSDWSGYGWQVATGRTDAGWTIEAFFPWSDIGARAEVGDLWMFNHVRYAYTSGRFQGVTWSPGGTYNNPENFGYLYFTQAGATSPHQVVKLVSEAIDPPWQLPLDEHIHVSQTAGQVESYQVDDWLSQVAGSLTDTLAQARAAARSLPTSKLPEKLDALAAQFAGMSMTANQPAEALDLGRRINDLQQQVEDLYWQARLQSLLQSVE